MHSALAAIFHFIASKAIASIWFYVVVAMNHFTLPTAYLEDDRMDWPTNHITGSMNLGFDLFTTWFTGHLNYQIEHHLFPTMPKHHLPLIQAEVEAYCKQYGLVYNCLSMYGAVQVLYHKLKIVSTHVDSVNVKVSHRDSRSKNSRIASGSLGLFGE